MCDSLGSHFRGEIVNTEVLPYFPGYQSTLDLTLTFNVKFIYFKLERPIFTPEMESKHFTFIHDLGHDLNSDTGISARKAV